MSGMEASSLSILVDEKRVNDLLKQKTGAKAFLRSTCNVIFFVVFLCLYTGLALSEPLKIHRQFEDYIRRRFDENAAMPLKDVKSINSFWEYTNKSFLPGIYSNDTEKYFFPGRVIPKFLPIDDNNRILGAGVRLRMIKIQPNIDCKVRADYEAFFPTCYGPYGQDYVQSEAFGPVGDTGAPAFPYTAGAEDDFYYYGKVSEYRPGGYMELLTADYNESSHRLRLLESENWLDESARALFYDFTIYNFNLGVYAVCSIAFEVSPSGAWVKTFAVTVLRQRHLNALGLQNTEDLVLLVCEILLIVCVIRYLLEEASEFMRCERRTTRGGCRYFFLSIKVDYFFDTWNLLDWANLVTIIWVLGIKVTAWMAASSREVYIGEVTGATVAGFTDYSAVAQKVRGIRSLTAFNTVLTWFKAVKYITIVPYITLFMQTVTVAEKSLSSFFIIFICAMIGFVLAYTCAFGESYVEFRNVYKSLYFLLRSFLGDSRMSIVYDAANFLGSLLIILFVLAMIFLMMSLFQAVIISALSDAKSAMALKKNTEWKRTLEKGMEFLQTVSEALRLGHRFRTFVPGLYSRIEGAKKKRADQEKARDEAEREKIEQSKSLEIQDKGGGGGEHGLGIGRRQKRPLVSLTNEDDEVHDSDEEGSEADLGPLRSQDQLVPANDGAFRSTGGTFDSPGLGDTQNSFGEPPTQPELEPEAKNLVIDATAHVVKGIVDHTRNARSVLITDMMESKEVLQGIGNVLEVLSRRARSLEAQQTELLRHF